MNVKRKLLACVLALTLVFSMSVNVFADEGATVQMASYDAHTERDAATTGDDQQILKVYLTFAEKMKIVDPSALADEITFTLGGSAPNKTTTTVTAVLSDDGKTLEIVYKGFFAAFNGKFDINQTLNNLVSEKTGAKAEAKATFIVPNGAAAITKEQVIADKTTNASVTTQITSDSNTTRGMVHIVLLKNGKPAVATNAVGAHVTGHWHAYMTLTGADFIKNTFVPSAEGTSQWNSSDLASEYTVTTNGDTVTVTAKNSNPGDVLEMHILSYLNSNAAVNADNLKAVITKAENTKLDGYTDASVAALKHQIQLAKVVAADTTYYAQSDINHAADRLNAAINGLETAKADGNTDGTQSPSAAGTDKSNTAGADAQTQTGDDFNMLPLLILMLLAAAAATVTVVYRRKNNA